MQNIFMYITNYQPIYQQRIIYNFSKHQSQKPTILKDLTL